MLCRGGSPPLAPTSIHSPALPCGVHWRLVPADCILWCTVRALSAAAAAILYFLLTMHAGCASTLPLLSSAELGLAQLHVSS